MKTAELVQKLSDTKIWKQAAKYDGKILLVVRRNDLLVHVKAGLILAVNLSSAQKATELSPDAFEQQHVKQLHYHGTFDVAAMELNSDGKLLALRGQHAVNVLVLPSLLGKDSALSSLTVGEFELGTDLHNPITTILWHPLGRNNAHLCVVSMNGITRLFDLAVDLQVPESRFRLHPAAATPTPSKKRSLVSDLDVVSCRFGQGQGWGTMTLFYLLRNGDIMSICPILPRHGKISQSQLTRLIRTVKNNVEVDGRVDEYDRDETFDLLLQLHRAQLSFLEKLQSSGIGAVSGDLLHFKSPCMENYEIHSGLVVYPRGPFRMFPTPIISLESSVEAVDLQLSSCVRTIGSKTLEVTVLGLLYQGGLADICILPSEEGPFWDNVFSNYREKADIVAPCLWVCESLDLAISPLEKHDEPQIRPNWQFDSSSPDTFYILHSCGLHSVNLEFLLSCFAESFASKDSMVKLKRLLDGPPAVAIRGIVNSRQHADQYVFCVSGDLNSRAPMPIQSIGWIKEATGSTLLILTASSEFIVIPQSQKSVTFALKKEWQPKKSQLSVKTSLLSELPLQECLPFIERTDSSILVGPVFSDEGRVLLSGNTKKYPHCVDKTNYEIMASETSALREKIQTLSTYLEVAKTRLTLLKQQQNISTTECDKALATGLSDSLSARIESATIRQSNIQKRLDICLNIALEYCTPSLSQAELDWCDEVRAFSHDSADLTTRSVQIIGMLEKLKSFLSSEAAASNASASGSYQLRGITELVEKESVFLNDICEKVRRLEAKIDRMSL